MRTPQQRIERAKMVKALCDIITDCNNDAEFFNRLLWASEWISNQLLSFENEGQENTDN